MTQPPYKLPEGWRWVKLGEVFEVEQGASMSPKRRLGRNPKPFLRTRNILWGAVDTSLVDEMDFTDEEAEKLSLQPGDLLVCEGGDVGRTAIWEGQLPTALYQNHIHRLRAKDDSVEPRFIMYWMQAAYQVFLAYQGEESRTAIPNLSGRRLKEFLAPLPPLEEQRRIVARIEALMERIREARRLREQVKEDTERLWQSALAETFPRPGSDLPAGWRWVKLGEVFEVQQGASMSPKRRLGRNPKPFLRTRNILWGAVDTSLVDEMDSTDEEAEKLSLQPGDLLVCEGGDVGRTAIWEGQLPTALYQNHIHRLRAKDDSVEPRFIMYWMQAAYQVFLAYQGEESRTAIPNLSGRRLKEFLAPLPPLEEQRHIVARLEAVQEKIKALKEIQAATDAELQRLEQAIFDRAFKGEL